MRTAILFGAGLGLALALPGVAAANTAGGPGMSYGGGNQGQAFQQNNAGIPASARRLHQELQRAGFTNIHIRPHSYLVRARDPDGNPVRIVVSPTAVAMATLDQSSGGNHNGGQGMQGNGQGGQGNGQSMQGSGQNGQSWNR